MKQDREASPVFSIEPSSSLNVPIVNNKLSPEKKAVLKRYKSQKARNKPVLVKKTIIDGEPVIKPENIDSMELSRFESTGLVSTAGSHLLTQVKNTFPTPAVEDKSQYVDAIVTNFNQASELMHAIAPQNGLEGMLASQMVACHNMSMELSRRAMESKDDKVIEANINRVTKLQRTFTAQVEALHKLRNGGRQQITVQHQNIQAQAGSQVIGNAIAGGEGSRG